MHSAVLSVLCAISVTSVGQKLNWSSFKEWTVVSEKRLDIKVNDYETAFVGVVTQYQNPKDPHDFAQVFTRHIPLISQRPKEDQNTGQRESSLTVDAGRNYHRNQEQEALQRVQKASDAFAIIRWRTTTDDRSGREILAGLVDYWLLNQDGNWMYATNASLSGISRTLVSEPSKADAKRHVVVGLKFSIGDAVHVVRIDQDDLMVPKDTKKKKVDNAK